MAERLQGAYTTFEQCQTERPMLSGVNYPGQRIASDEIVTGLPH